MEKIMALLPIKENSERVPGKNFRILGQKPVYQWILDTLLHCKNVSGICIDTDSEAFIEELRQQYPMVHTILRPEEIRGGAVSMNLVIDHDIRQYPDCEHFFQTHTTNPLLSAASIDTSIERYFTSLDQFDSMFSVNRIQARTYWRDASPINHSLGELKRTQDLEPVFEENSNFFIFSRTSFAKTQSRLGASPQLFETPRGESFEIDEEDDFQLLAQLIRGQINNDNSTV